MRLCGPRKIRVIGHGSANGFCVDQFSPQRFTDAERRELKRSLGLHPEHPIVGYVGRIAGDKGLNTLDAAMRRLLKDPLRVQLLLLGDIDDDEGAAALARLRTLPIPVAHAAYRDDPAIFFAAMDILCLPTRREGFGNVLAEASLSSRPVIASRVTGTIDAVVDGKTGILVEPDDEVELALALTTLLTDETCQHRLGEQGRLWAQSRFSRRTVAQGYVEEIERAAGIR